jgi:hypothetical protein
MRRASCPGREPCGAAPARAYSPKGGARDAARHLRQAGVGEPSCAPGQDNVWEALPSLPWCARYRWYCAANQRDRHRSISARARTTPVSRATTAPHSAGVTPHSAGVRPQETSSARSARARHTAAASAVMASSCVGAPTSLANRGLHPEPSFRSQRAATIPAACAPTGPSPAGAEYGFTNNHRPDGSRSSPLASCIPAPSARTEGSSAGAKTAKAKPRLLEDGFRTPQLPACAGHEHKPTIPVSSNHPRILHLPSCSRPCM